MIDAPKTSTRTSNKEVQDTVQASCGSPLAACLVALCLSFCYFAPAQVAYPEQEIRVSDLPALTAQSRHASDVLATSLQIIFNDKEICCGKNSALEDSVQSANPKSLRDIAAKLQGRHLLSDGRPIKVTAEYLAPNDVNAGHLIAMIQSQHPPLMEWNSHLYLVCGVTYVQTVDYSDGESVAYAVHKFLLQDVRYSDSRRALTFDRLTDDANTVQGLLFLQVAAQ
jgi:hypothetical protein